MIRGARHGGPGRGARARRRRPARRRMPPATRAPGAAAPGPRSARRPRRRARPVELRSGGTSRPPRGRAPPTIASQVAMRATSRSSSSSPRARAAWRAAGRRSAPSAAGGSSRRLTPAPADQAGAIGHRPGPPSGGRSRGGPGRGRRGVVVVTNACGRAAIRRTRWTAGPGRAREKTSSSRSSGGRPSRAVRRSSSASLRARIAVRCWPREANAARSRPAELEGDVVAVRPDERGAVPDLLLGRLDEPALERVPWRLPGQRRRVGHVAQPRAASAPSSGSDLGMGRGQRLGKRLEERAGARPRSCRPPRGTRRPSSAARRAMRLLLADRPQQAVALLEARP